MGSRPHGSLEDRLLLFRLLDNSAIMGSRPHGSPGLRVGRLWRVAKFRDHVIAASLKQRVGRLPEFIRVNSAITGSRPHGS